MFTPTELNIKIHSKIFCCIGWLKSHAIDGDWNFVNSLICEVELVSFSLIRHFLVQVATLFTACWSLSFDSSSVFPTANNAVSSAKIAIVVLKVLGISLIILKL